MAAGLSDFFKYNLWANQRLLDACSQLTDDQLDFISIGVYGSIRDTFVHIIASEERYARDVNVEHLTMTPHLDESSPFPGFDELQQRVKLSGTALIAAAEQSDPGEILHLPDDYVAPVVVVLIQAINHGVDHRSQIATLLSLQGIQPPRMDGWGYNNDVLRSSIS